MASIVTKDSMAEDASTVKAPSLLAASSFSRSSSHWSEVFTAGKDSSPDARAAFGELYVAYLPPLLAYLRSKGNSQDRAMDLLHGFFEHLLETNGLSTVEKRGKFRNWLLRALDHFMTDEWREQHALKRGAGESHLPIGPDFEAGEVEPPATGLTPEQAFDRKWAIALLKRVLTRLQGEYAQAGKQTTFAELKDFLPGGHAAFSHQEIADRLKMQANTVTVNIKRLRERYGELLRAEISDTTDPDTVEEEWHHLQVALGGRPETVSGDSKA